MEYGQMMNQAKENAKLAFYQNPSYQLERREKKTVILDVSSPNGDKMPTEFNVKLLEPLIVDRLSDVYLDSFITCGAHLNTGINPSTNGGVKNMGFTLKINEFNINSNVASNIDKNTNGYDSKKFNSIFIPNSAGVAGTVSHKTKKFNYVASINPCTISSLSGEILDAGTGTATPIYASPFTGDDTRFLAEFIIVARD